MLNLRIGFFLGLRQIRRANIWATLLIITVVIFTFINLVAVSGILRGIVDGALAATRNQAVGDVVINPLETENRLLETGRIFRELEKYPEVESFSPHYEELATIEANYQDRRDLQTKRDIISTTITGIDSLQEDATLGLGALTVEGEYLSPDDQDYILIGKYYIDRFAAEYGDIYNSFKNVYPGDKVRITVGNQTKEYTVKGIVDSKIDIVSLKIYLPEKEFRRLFNRADRSADSIAINLKPDTNEAAFKAKLLSSGIGELGKVEIFSETIPKFIKDVTKTFDTLSLFIGIIGIVVAAITVFIITFINILTRRRQIGILKAIGISRRAIEYSYATQAVFYAVIGSTVGVVIVFFGLVPYFAAHPIDFPYSDVVLEASVGGAALRVSFLCVIMLIAGFFPAWLITRQNTLSAILGRK